VCEENVGWRDLRYDVGGGWGISVVLVTVIFILIAVGALLSNFSIVWLVVVCPVVEPG
jgi:hypothetical protein